MAQQEMIPYADDPFMAEALTYVYIAQFGLKRAGVLVGDCRRYFSQIKQLLSSGDIQNAKYYQLEGFVTTSTGSQKAQSIINNGLVTHTNRLESALGGISQRCLQYLLDIICADDRPFNYEGRRVQIDKNVGQNEGGYNLSNDRPTYSCLLSNRDIRDMRDRLFQTLTAMKLVVKAHDYVTTRGGEEREFMYVPAPELQSFYRDYLAKIGLTGYLWPEELEEMHNVFHILDSSSSLQSWEELDRKIPVRYWESVKEFINECLTRGALKESTSDPANPYLTINDALWYNTERARCYQKPLLDFLLGKNAPLKPPVIPIPPPIHPPEEPNPPIPPVDFNTILIGSSDFNDTDRGILGWSNDNKVELDMFVGRKGSEERAHTISVFGIPKFGKSYTLGVIIEMALAPQPGIRNGLPLASVVFHYDKNVTYKPEFANLVNPTTDNIEELNNKLGMKPKGIPDVVILVPPWRLNERIKQFPGAQVQPLLFSPKELSQFEWRLLMGVPGSEALYVEQVKQVLLKLDISGSLNIKSIQEGVEMSGMSNQAKKLAQQRLDIASQWVKDNADLSSALKPGRLLILDVRDNMIDPADAMRLCLISLGLFQQVQGQDGLPMPKLIVLDEAHKYVQKEFADEIVTVVNQMRHTATSVIIASQNPDSIPSDVLEKSSIVILHRLTSPHQVGYLKKSVYGLSKVSEDAVAKLKKGEAIIWATESTDAQAAQSGIKVKIRPRFTRHV